MLSNQKFTGLTLLIGVLFAYFKLVFVFHKVFSFQRRHTKTT